MLAAAFAILLAASPRHDARSEGLGRSCHKNSDCKSKSQRCLHESDMNGKPVTQGFCALPCASFEAGTTKVIPGAPLEATPKNAKVKKIPSRCPPKYECREKGQGVPIDMCVKE
jgi:hypothetical protein